MKTMNERPPRKKWKHLSHFALGEDGKYTYSGSFMICALPAEQYRRRCRKMLAASLLSAALLVAVGCIPHTGMEGNAFLLMPWGVSLIAGLLLCWSVFMMQKNGPILRQYQYEKTVYAVSRRAAAGILGTGAGMACWFILLLRRADSGTGIGYVLLRLSFPVCFAAFLTVYRHNKALSWKADQDEPLIPQAKK